jgi:hypothetical protein
MPIDGLSVCGRQSRRLNAGNGFDVDVLAKLAHELTPTKALVFVALDAGDEAERLAHRFAKGVGARQTGWTAMTGTGSKGGFDTSSVTLLQLAQVVKALVDERLAAGSIGA